MEVAVGYFNNLSLWYVEVVSYGCQRLYLIIYIYHQNVIINALVYASLLTSSPFSRIPFEPCMLPTDVSRLKFNAISPK
jgi:hypothetical protein